MIFNLYYLKSKIKDFVTLFLKAILFLAGAAKKHHLHIQISPVQPGTAIDKPASALG